MQVQTETGASAPVFSAHEFRVGTPYPEPEVLEKNIRHNMAQNWPRFHLRPDFGKPGSRKDKPLAICAGGPSMKDFIGKIYDDFTNVMVCGSAHDYLVEHGIDPTYSVQLDGDPIAKTFATRQLPDVQYLIASQCDPIMFEGLTKHQVSMWHCAGCVEDKHFQGEPAVCGGCTTTLRAINIAIMLGYYDLHMFGFDSCFTDVEAQHAYDYKEWGTNLNELLVRIDDGPVFKSNALFVAQAQNFQGMCSNFGHLFEPHVYGDGLIAEMIRVGKAKAEKGEAA